MQTHPKEVIDTVSCPFAIPMNKIEWEGASVISVDDRDNTVVVKTNGGEKILVSIPEVLYNAIWKSGEINVTDQDPGFYDIS